MIDVSTVGLKPMPPLGVDMSEDLSLRALIKAAGKTQAQIADDLGVDRTYVSQMVNGKVNWVNSAYFPALVTALGLNFRQIQQLKPDAVTGLVSAAIKTGAALTLKESAPHARPLPQGLQDAIDAFGKRFPDLLDAKWQQYLAGFQWRRGIPEDPTAWLDLYRDLDRAGVVPGEE